MVYELVESGKARQLPVLCSAEPPNRMPLRICPVLFLCFIIACSPALLLSRSVHFVLCSGVDKSQQLPQTSGCSHSMIWAQSSKTYACVPLADQLAKPAVLTRTRWTSKAWVAAKPLRNVMFQVKVVLFHSMVSGNRALTLKPVQSDPNSGVYLTFKPSRCVCFW